MRRSGTVWADTQFEIADAIIGSYTVLVMYALMPKQRSPNLPLHH